MKVNKQRIPLQMFLTHFNSTRYPATFELVVVNDHIGAKRIAMPNVFMTMGSVETNTLCYICITGSGTANKSKTLTFQL